MINGLSVAAVICLHFGKSYLSYAMRSVADVVDEYLVMYSPVPNHGVFDTAHPCPETREQLMDALYWEDHQQAHWYESSSWRSEGEQFQSAWQYTSADVIVKLDADEVWHPGLLRDAAQYGIEQGAREIRLPLRHYWRSFHKAFTHDPAAPGRIYIRSLHGETVTFDTPDNAYRIHHFGYAMPVDVTRYKMGIHGHKPEFTNPNWFENVFLTNRQVDCHPIGSDYWMQAEAVEPPAFMSDHPFYDLEVIE